MPGGNPHGNAPGGQPANYALTEESGAAKDRNFAKLIHLAGLFSWNLMTDLSGTVRQRWEKPGSAREATEWERAF
jgi:hypothetical protein